MNKSINILLFLICFLFIPTTFLYSDIHFKHLSQLDGLLSNKIQCILKDSRGFMWFGTELGLNRYDGKSIKVYKHDPDDSTSISHNQIQVIYEDKEGIIWIITYGGGLNKYDPITDKFTHFKHDPNDSMSISNDFLLSMCEGKSGILWIGTGGTGIDKFDINKNKFTNYTVNKNNTNSISHGIVRALYEDKSGIVWIGTTGGGLNRFDPKTGTFTHFTNDPKNPQSLSNNSINDIREDKEGNLWIAAGQLNRFDKIRRTFYRYVHNPDDPKSIVNNSVRYVCNSASNPDILWIATKGGLEKFDIRKNIFIHFNHIPDNPNSINTNQTLTVYEDDSGFLWIGTEDGGVNICKNKPAKISHYTYKNGDTNSLSSNNISEIHEDGSGLLWIGGRRGLNCYDRTTQKFIHYLNDPENPFSISNNTVRCIIEEKPGILWIGTDSGLNRFETITHKFTRFFYEPLIPVSESNNSVFALYLGRGGELFVGAIEGGFLIFNFNPDGESVFKQFKHDPTDSTSISDNTVLTVYEDTMGNVWIGTMCGGLNKFNKKEKQFIHYEHDPKNRNSISNNCVNAIYEDNNGIFWIGTFGGGLTRFDPSTETFNQYREKDGLANDIIFGILEDNDHNLWISTRNGLSRFNPRDVDSHEKTKPTAFRNFYTEDGLVSHYFNYSSYYKTEDGEMFFGTTEGLNSIYPENFEDNQYIPPVFITDFKVFNEAYPLDTAITEINNIILSNNENFISFEFAALDYSNPKKNKYAYKMEGVDHEWIQTDATRSFASYTAIDPGNYIFRVKGSNNDGVWNEVGASVNITILPPWWRTNLAYAMYVLFFLSTVYGIWRLQTNRLKLKHQIEIEHLQGEKYKEVDRLRSQFFTNISHEFRTPITLILGPLEKMLSYIKDGEIKEDLSMMQRNAFRLHRLINQLLDLSKLEAGKMMLQVQTHDIVSLVNRIIQTFESQAKLKNISLQFRTREKRILLYIDRDKIENIFYNLLSNALKFTPAGGKVYVKVGLKIDDSETKSVEIAVRDAGPGIQTDRQTKIFDRFYRVEDSNSHEQEGTGIGLALTKELVELHKGKIYLNSEVGRGSTFIVELPLGKEPFSEEEIINEPVTENDRELTECFQLPEKIQGEGEIGVEKNENFIKTLPALLVVEDNADMRIYLRESLKQFYFVLEASNGEEGLKKAFQKMPVLIISDVMMPKMNGFELCAKLKSDQRTSHIPLILLTARAADEDKIGGLKTGVDDYLTKPFNTNELLVRVENLIEQRRRLKERFSRELSLEPKEITLTSMDEKFMQRAMQIVETNISNPEFNVDTFFKEMGLSRTNLYLKINALTGLSVKEFIRNIRLKRAAQLLDQHTGTVSEIAYEVGFNNPSYFSECFYKQFKQLPSKYKSEHVDS